MESLQMPVFDAGNEALLCGCRNGGIGRAALRRALSFVIASASEAIQCAEERFWIASSLSLLAMTESAPAHLAKCAVNG
jgi:hypothetical protein